MIVVVKATLVTPKAAKDTPFGDNSPISHTSQTSLGWASLPRLKKRFDVLVLGNRLSVLATIKLMLLETLIVTMTGTARSTQLLMEDSTTGRLGTSSQSLSAMSNCHFLFYYFEQFVCNFH